MKMEWQGWLNESERLSANTDEREVTSEKQEWQTEKVTYS